MENNTPSDSATPVSGAAKSNSDNTVPADHQLYPNSLVPPIVPDQSDEPTVPEQDAPARLSSRTPFTTLSQIDADLALARTLQEQERAYMMLRMNGGGSGFGSWEARSYADDDEEGDFDDTHDQTDSDDDEEVSDGIGVDDEEDEFEVHAVEDPNAFPSDEAYARALQDAEDREMATRLLALAGLHDSEADEADEENGGNSQDTWDEVDPDELSYEELLALGEVVGNESRGLSADTINSLPTATYSSGSGQAGSNDSCVICRLDYEDGDDLIVLSCRHSYHSECITNWLKINKVCPVCSAEVSTAGDG